MAARTQRTLLAVGVPLVVLILAVGALTLAPSLNPQLYAMIVGLALIAGRALSKWLEDSNANTAAPTTPAVNAALDGRAATVPPPSTAVPAAPVTLDTLPPA